jgi:hypothetical protein
MIYSWKNYRCTVTHHSPECLMFVTLKKWQLLSQHAAYGVATWCCAARYITDEGMDVGKPSKLMKD